jgi:hypothetical protein
MAIDNQTLQVFFNKQKKPRINALLSANTLKKNNSLVSQNTNKNNKTIESKVVPNQYQTDTKVTPNQYQSDTIDSSNWYQSGNRTDTRTNTKLIPNQYQTDTKTGFFSLTGLQKKIAITIYKLCQISRDKKTDAVSIIQLSNQCQSPSGAVKMAVHRLIDKGIILRESFKNGRGGWTVYSIPNNTYQEIFNLDTQSELLPKWYQSDIKLVTKLVSEVIPNSTSSSGINYLNTTTTSEPENSKSNNLNDEWLKIDIEPLSTIGFTKTHLMQIASQNILSVELVQGSIYAFAFDLQENDKEKNIKGDPINFFMGILRNGKPYAPPSNYESPQDKAMREYKEKMLKIEQGRAETEKEAVNLAFNDWFSQLTDEQKKEFLPDMLRRNTTSEKLGKNKMLEGSARSHFEAEIWPDIKNKIISSAALKTTEQARKVNEETQ